MRRGVGHQRGHRRGGADPVNLHVGRDVVGVVTSTPADATVPAATPPRSRVSGYPSRSGGLASNRPGGVQSFPELHLRVLVALPRFGVSPQNSSTDGTVGCFFSSGVAAVAAAGAAAADLDLRYGDAPRGRARPPFRRAQRGGAPARLRDVPRDVIRVSVDRASPS